MRHIFSGVTLLSALFMPVWVFLVLAFGFSLRYRAWEVICIAFIIDCIYLSTDGIFGIPFFATLVASVLVWGLEPLRNRFVFR